MNKLSLLETALVYKKKQVIYTPSMQQLQVTVLQNRPVALDCYEMTFSWPENVKAPQPGQFFTVLVSDSAIPFLRRPLAFSSFDEKCNAAGVIYQKRGAATEILSKKIPGDLLDILGPRGFYFQLGKFKKPILIGGGIGTGPMVFAANKLAAKGLDPLLVLGFRGKDWYPETLLNPKVTLALCTDDGSLGFKGTSLDYLKQMDEGSLADAFIWACGPLPMLKAAHSWSQTIQRPCWVSLEEVMACAVGACAGCVVETTDARKMVRVCTEGPVFASEVVKWT